jgi:hypothetical protein
VAERQTRDERGDEAVAIEPERARVSGQRKGEHRRPGEVLRTPSSATCDPHSLATYQADDDPDPEADRQIDQSDTRAVFLDALGGDGAGDRHHHHRSRDAVVEPAFHVQHAPDPFRYRRIGHHRRAQRRVGGCQRSTDQQRQPETHAVEQPHRQQRPRGDGQRQSHPEQARVQSAVGPKLTQPHPGRVREQHPHQSDLGKQLDGLRREVELDDVQHLGEQEPHGDEDDRRAQIRATEPR